MNVCLVFKEEILLLTGVYAPLMSSNLFTEKT